MELSGSHLPPVGFRSCVNTLLSDEDSNVFMEELKPTRGKVKSGS